MLGLQNRLQNLPNEIIATILLPELPKCLTHSDMSIGPMMDLHMWRRVIRLVLCEIRHMKKFYRTVRFTDLLPVLRSTCSPLYEIFELTVPYWSGKMSIYSHYQWRYDRDYIWEELSHDIRIDNTDHTFCVPILEGWTTVRACLFVVRAKGRRLRGGQSTIFNGWYHDDVSVEITRW
jgi:hypothetical protein